jgi:heme/copper-type cytochrome/quinol oxidase subunit 2
MIDSAFLACSTCRVTMVEAGGNAASWSIFFLLIVILTVMGSVGFFMFRIARREKEHFDPSLTDNWSIDDTRH